MDESVPAVEKAQASDDTTEVVDAASAPTAAAIAKAAAEDNGHMQQDQQDHAVGAGESAPFAGTADDGSLFSAATAATTTPTADTAPSGHATGEHKEQTSPTDLAASPRSGAAPGFVAPSSYLRPLAATRDREGSHRTGNQPFTASESGAKRPMHPLDREQREGLVSGFSSASVGNAMLGYLYGYMLARERWLTVYTARYQSLSQGPHDL